MLFSRLIRFLDEDENEKFGDPVISSTEDLLELSKQGKLQAKVLDGSSPFDLAKLSKSSSAVRVKEILPILTPDDVPIVRCIGLNYIKHIQEGGRNPPPYPSVFTKSRHTIASFHESIPIPRLAQDNQCDYEGELGIVIGKTGKNISRNDVVDHVLGYVVANDVSARTWQRDPKYAGGVPQWDFSKGFDKYCPLGPMIVAPDAVTTAGSGGAKGQNKEARNLRLQTWVNNELRQDSDTGDLLFGVVDIISFISQGTTLERGTVILTGTPAGVGMGFKPEPKYLKDGDVVKVKIEGLGYVENEMRFEKE